jgi:iron(III) transport system substrate-binding protein
LLTPFRPSHAGDLPDTFKTKDGTWYGFAARARILLVNTKLVPEAARPNGIKDLLDPRWKGQIGIAKPLFGTTATQAACLFTAWGEEKAKSYFRERRRSGLARPGQEQLLRRPLQSSRGQLPGLQSARRQANPVPVGQDRR